MLGVMDGHGVNGHNVSQYVKQQLPAILQNLIAGQSPDIAINTNGQPTLTPKK
jgi:serine/threonine protein phosphatase PrpC